MPPSLNGCDQRFCEDLQFESYFGTAFQSTADQARMEPRYPRGSVASAFRGRLPIGAHDQAARSSDVDETMWVLIQSSRSL